MKLKSFAFLSLLALNSGLAFSDADRSDTLAGDEGLPSLWRRVLSCGDDSLKVQVELVNGRGTRIVVSGEKNVSELRKAGPIGQIQNNGKELVLDAVQSFSGAHSVPEIVCSTDFTSLKRRFITLTYDQNTQTVGLVATDTTQLPAGSNLPLKTYKLSFPNCRAHGEEDFPANGRNGGAKNQFELTEDAILFAKAGQLIERNNCGVDLDR